MYYEYTWNNSVEQTGAGHRMIRSLCYRTGRLSHSCPIEIAQFANNTTLWTPSVGISHMIHIYI